MAEAVQKEQYFFANWHLLEKTLHFLVLLSEIVVAAAKFSPLLSRNNSRLYL